MRNGHERSQKYLMLKMKRAPEVISHESRRQKSEEGGEKVGQKMNWKQKIKKSSRVSPQEKI